MHCMGNLTLFCALLGMDLLVHLVFMGQQI